MAKQPKAAKRTAIIIVVVVAVCAAAFAWYVSDYSRADVDALAALADSDGPADGVTVRTLKGGEIAFCPKQANAGLIFYPGGKVQPEAYAPLLTECARQGILCVLVKPPFDLPILDANAADGLQTQFPEIEKWVIGGHSLGGVVASTYLAGHSDDFSAIAFLAAYPTEDLSKIDIEALSIVGSNDSILDRAEYDEATNKMPAHMRELIIPGGNHANFGNYGAQQNDGEATITREEQQILTARAIAGLAEAA